MKNILLLFFFLLPQLIFSQNYVDLGDNALKNDFNFEKALEYYSIALGKDPTNISIINRISNTLIHIGDKLPQDLKDIETEHKFGMGINSKKESLDSSEIAGAQIDNYKKALSLATQALDINPKDAEAYVRRAVANARIAVTKGIFSVAKIVNQVKDDLEMAIKIGTGGNDIQAIAHYVLAKTHDEVSEKWKPARSIIGLGWGDLEIALQEYNIAINLKDNVRMFYLDYGKALLEDDDIIKAKEILSKIKNCPVLDVDDNNRLEEANKILAELE